MSEDILLLSGGIESSTLLYQLTKQERPIRALFINYAQRAAERELSAATQLSNTCGVPLTTLDMSSVGNTFRAEQEQKLHIPLPHRNLVALSLALSYATQHQAKNLYIAINQDDLTAYPSADGSFLEQFAQTCQLLGQASLQTPFATLTKADIVKLGGELGVDYTLSYSCMLGYERACGHCSQCINRREAFLKNGLDEPCLPYRN